MADFSHAPFRELIAGLGGCDLFFTEMLNSRILTSKKIEDDYYLVRARNDKPLFAQIAGREPEKIAQAIDCIKDMFEGFNINMGCARGKIQRFGWGVSLMADMDLASSIVKEARKAVSSELTVKLRSGLSEHNISYLKNFCLMLQNEGVDSIILHPRTGTEKLSRRARWNEIKEIKETLSIPVIGNGDIFGPEDAKRMIQETGCDGIMIGRAALIRPWIFRDIKAYLNEGNIPPPPDPLYVVDEFYRNLLFYSPPELVEKRFLDFCFWFFQNWGFALHWYSRVKRADNKLEETKRILEKRPSIRPYPITPFMTK